MGFFGKKTAGAVTNAAPKASATPDAGPSRKVWGVLLVLSIVMVFIFGGAVAGLVYMRMSTPPLASVPSRPPKKKGAAAAADAPKPDLPKAEPPKAEAPKPEEPKKPEAKAPDRPTGSPAVHAAALPKHSADPISSTAKTEKPAPPPAAAKPAGGKVRAMAVEFSHKAPSAKEVLLRGPFLVRTGGKQAMVKDSEGVWKLSLSLLPGGYKYSFMVDGKRTPIETKQVQ